MLIHYVNNDTQIYHFRGSTNYYTVSHPLIGPLSRESTNYYTVSHPLIGPLSRGSKNYYTVSHPLTGPLSILLAKDQ